MTAEKAIQKSGDLIRKRLQGTKPTKPKGKNKGKKKIVEDDVNTIINNLIART